MPRLSIRATIGIPAKSTARGTARGHWLRRDLFHQAQRGEGLAGAAGHDELAPVDFLVSCDDVTDGFGLMLADYLLRLEPDVLDVGETELAPVDRTVGQVLEPKPGNRDGLVRQGFLGVLAPFVGRGNDDQRWLKPRSPGAHDRAVSAALPASSISVPLYLPDCDLRPRIRPAPSWVEHPCQRGHARYGVAGKSHQPRRNLACRRRCSHKIPCPSCPRPHRDSRIASLTFTP